MDKIGVLLVDDHELIKNGIKLILQENNTIEVVADAANAREALDLYERTEPDVIVMDISLPDRSGIEASESILYKYPNARIVILSMYFQEEYIEKCLALGIKGYIVKSDAGGNIVKAILEVYKGGRYYSERVQDVLFEGFAKSKGIRIEDDKPQLSLTKREMQVLKLVCRGMTSPQISAELDISSRTVDTHRANLMKKLKVKKAIELVSKASELGILES